MRAFVTGGAGFIGSSLVDRLLAAKHSVVAYDNFSTGRDAFLQVARSHPQFTLVRGDTLDLPALVEAMAGSEMVFHLAANADVRFGVEHPRTDLDQNTIATFNVLEDGQPALPRTNVGDIRDRGPMGLCHRELTLQQIRDQDGWLARGQRLV